MRDRTSVLDLACSLALGLLLACGSSPPGESAAIASPAPAEPAPAPAVAEPTVLTEAQLRREAQYAPLARAIADAYPNRIGWYSTMIANWSPDGRSLLFGSLRTGTPHIYAGDPERPADPPLAITSGDERGVWATYTTDGKYVLFLRDRGGDERHHIWRVGADGSDPIDMTPDTVDARLEPRLARDRPDVMVYSEFSVKDQETRVYLRSIAGGPPRLVHTSPGIATHGDVAPDGSRCLFGTIAGPNDMVLSELDLTSGALRRIFPAAGKQAYLTSAMYSADYSRVFITVEEGDATVALALALDTGEELARHSNPSQPSAGLEVIVSPAGDYVIGYVDAGNHGELRVLDARTLALVRPIQVPLGELKVGAFRPDGREFAIMMSLPHRPPDLYAVDPTSGQVRPLRADPRPDIDILPRMHTSIAEIAAHDGLTIPINVYLPADDADAPPIRRPTVVIFHGGPAASAAVRWDPYVRFLVALGYVVLEPNVRGSSGFGRAFEKADDREKRADWLADLATVNAWTRSQPWCDPARVAVFGASYGGYTTLMALTRQPHAWRAGVDLYGPSDLNTFMGQLQEQWRPGMTEEFGDAVADAALLAEFSPMRDVDRIVAPLFVYAGQNDPRVPRSESDRIVQALRDRGRTVEYMVAAGEGHNAELRDTQIELLTRIARFLAEAMGPPPGAAPVDR